MNELYHHPMSAASRAVRLVLGEYGIHPDLREEQVWDRRDEFLALNPAATLPVYVDGDMHVVGASATAEYLDETIGPMKREARIFPEDARGRAEMRRIAEWCLVKLETEVTRYTVNERVLKRIMPPERGGGPPDSRALRAARTNIKYHLKYLGYLAANRRWLAGDQMTWADLTAAASLSVLDYLGEIDWADDEYLREWYARLKSRPSFRPLLGDRVRGIPPVSHYADLDF